MLRLTVFFNGQFWEGVVEEENEGKLKAFREIFGQEPGEREFLDLVLFKMLPRLDQISSEVSSDVAPYKRPNPKKLSREISRQMKARGVSTYAQKAIKLAHEQNKAEKQVNARQRKKELSLMKRELKVCKKKEKHKGR